MKYKPDLRLFDDWDAVKDKSGDFPMIAVFEFEGKKLVYVGTAHNNLKHPAPRSFDAINHCFDNFKIDCVVTECDHTTKLEDWHNGIGRVGGNELVYAPYLGRGQNIPYIFADASVRDWIGDVIKSRPDAIQDLQTMLVLDEARLYKEHFGKSGTIQSAIDSIVHRYWRDSYPAPMSASEFKKHCKKYLGLDITDENVSDILSAHPDWNRPGQNGNIINRAWSDIDMYSRDPRMLKNIFDAVNRHECVLVTAGYGHFAKQRRVLEHAFGAPKIISDFPHTPRRDMPDVYDRVQGIIDKLHDPKTGFNGLRNSIAARLARELPDELAALRAEYKNKKSKTLQAYIWYIVLNKIDAFEADEHPGPELTNEQRKRFEDSVFNELKTFLTNRAAYAESHDLDAPEDLDSRRFKLSAENIIKYRYYASCGNAADAFAYKNQQLGPDRMPLAFVHSTRWDHLIDGRLGHTIPCVQTANGDWVALDPQVWHADFITSELKSGNKIEHLLTNHSGVPYMITQITDENYNDHDTFLAQASKVAYHDAMKFLETISGDVDAAELEEYKKKISREYFGELTQATHAVKNKGQNAIRQSVRHFNDTQND